MLNTGWAVYCCTRKAPIAAGVSVVKAEGDGGWAVSNRNRMLKQAQAMRSVARKYFADTIAMEHISILRDSSSAVKLAMAHGILCVFWDYEPPFGLLHAAAAKEVVGEGASKDEIVAWAEKKWPGLLDHIKPAERNHAADALLIAQCCFNRTGV